MYIDAFAGSGQISLIDTDATAFCEGSATRAIDESRMGAFYQEAMSAGASGVLFQTMGWRTKTPQRSPAGRAHL